MLDASRLLEYSSDPAFSVDREMRVTGWNAAAENFLGYTGAETLGLPCRSVLRALYPTGESLCSAICQGGHCVKSGEKWGLGNCRIRHKNGEFVPAGISSMVLPAEARTLEDDTIAILFLRSAYSEPEGLVPDLQMRAYTLGRFELTFGGRGLNVDSWKRKKSLTVMKCLLCNLDVPVHRERLIEWIWPQADPASGWKRLKVTVSALRSALRDGGADPAIIETVGESYLLRRETVCLDSDAFCAFVAQGQTHLKAGEMTRAQARFEDADSLYRGELHEEEPYADWCSVERERLREINLEMLAGMALCYSKQGHYISASRVCQAALSTDPCRENFVRILIDSLVNVGHPDWARAQFLTWRRALETEYGLHPTEATLRVYDEHFGQGAAILAMSA